MYGQGLGLPAPVQQHRQAHQHHQVRCQSIPGRNQILDVLEHQLAAMRADQARDQMLLLRAKPGMSALSSR